MQQNVLRNVREGMKVVDARRNEIGKVEFVQYGNDDPATPDIEAETTQGMEDGREPGLLDVIADAFRTDEVAPEVQERLLMQGFVRIDADGLFAADRYVLPDQIGGVSGDELVLNVSKDELLKRN